MNILVKGLDTFEKKILQTTALLSQKREYTISLIEESNIGSADVILIDAKDDDAMAWAQARQTELNDSSVVWIDGQAQSGKHAELKRPILWVNLPTTITRILDDLSVSEALINDKPREFASEENVAVQPKTVGGEAPSHAISSDFSSKIDATNSKAEAPVESASDNSRSENILVVDDSLAIRNYLTSLLENEGYNIHTAESGDEALDLIKDGKTYDCILMDVLMPGTNGYTACRKIKASKVGKNTPVIMLTGKGAPFDKIRGKMSGCHAYLTKPIDIAELSSTLAKTFEETGEELVPQMV